MTVVRKGGGFFVGFNFVEIQLLATKIILCNLLMCRFWTAKLKIAGYLQ